MISFIQSGDMDAVVAHVERSRLLLHDVDLVVKIRWIVRADLGTVAVLERG